MSVVVLHRCVLRAVVPIAKGGEVLDNYGHFFHSTTVNERREVLLNQYKFECDCEACSAMWPLYPHHTTEILIFRCPSPGCYSPCSYLTSSRTSCNVCGNEQQYAKLMRDMEQLLKQYKELLDQVKTCCFIFWVQLSKLTNGRTVKQGSQDSALTSRR